MVDMSALEAGFYTVPEAARLIRVGDARRIYGWVRGYPDRDVGPILKRDFEPIGKDEELSFLDLMEVRFVMYFREAGVRMGVLRRASEQLRKDFDTSHPFALSRVLLQADAADVYVVRAIKQNSEEGDVQMRSLTTNNYVMRDVINQSILPGIEFDTATCLAKSWKPLPDQFPEIEVNPRRGFGQPTVKRGVPTGTLYRAWQAEKESTDRVADWFSVTAKDVMDAVRFEQTLDEFASKQAA